MRNEKGTVVLHVADLHFGRTLQDRSLLDDQRDWSRKFVDLVRRERPAAVVVAGDVYDRAAPSGDAVELLDRFLTDLLDADDGLAVMVVAGNHDSGQRLSFGSELLRRQRLFIAGRTERDLVRVPLRDGYGEVVFWLMPYTFPAAIAQALGDGDDAPRTYTEAVGRYLAAQGVDPAVRNVLVAHQTVTSGGRDPEQGGSETMIGGVGGIDAAAFDAFDYVALGHVHKAQAVGRETIRYAGSPLCYHFDEARWPRKGAVRVELGAKGAPVDARLVEIPPLHPLRVVEGAYDEIVAAESAGAARGEYVKVVLADCRVEPAKADALRALFARRDSVALGTVSPYRTFSGTVADASGGPARERSLAEKLAGFWRARHGGTDPDERTLGLVRLAAGAVEAGRGDADADARARVEMATRKG
jgi:exonuclease SbcD